MPSLAGLLENGPDPAVEALFDKHCNVSHAELRQAQLAEAEAIFGEVLGDETMQGNQAQSVDDMMRHAAQRPAAQAQAELQAEQQARDARQARSQAQLHSNGEASQADAAQQRKEDAALQAGPMPGWCTTTRRCVSSWQRCSRRWPPMRSPTR